MTTEADVLAVGWATVDLDRAAGEWAHLLVAGTTFGPAAASESLGAFCRIGHVAPGRETPAALIVLLEPTTEGRLAATLARHGEGWWVTWLRGATPPTADAAAVPPGRAAWLDGPLGPERLIAGGSVFGPHRLLVPAATIAS